MISFEVCTGKTCVRTRAQGGIGELILALAIGYAVVEILPQLLLPDSNKLPFKNG